MNDDNGNLALARIEVWRRAARILGAPDHIAIVDGVNDAKQAFGVDFSPLLRADWEDCGCDEHDNERPTATVQMLADRLELSVEEANDFLLEAGLQYFDGKEWTPTIVGSDTYCKKIKLKGDGFLLWNMEKVIKDFCQF